MSRHGDVTRPFGDGEYVFRLGIAEWRKIDDRFDLGPYELLRRVATGRWKVDHLREVIRLGLVAGKSVLNAQGHTDDQRIAGMVREFVDERPLLPTSVFVAELLTAILDEPPGETIPKPEAAKVESELSQMEGLPSPLSTGQAPSSDSPPTKSTRSRSGSSEPVLQATRSRTGRSRSRKPQAQMSSTT